MKDDPIRAALGKACREMRCGAECRREQQERGEVARLPSIYPECCAPLYAGRGAAAIAAFLRALPGLPSNMGSMDLAAAVERAAKEAGDA